MPITNGLENSRKLRETGFTQQQSEVLAEIIEHAQQQGFDRFSEILERGLAQVSNEIALLASRFEALKSRVDSKIGALESRFGVLESRVDSKIEGLGAELHSSLRDQLLKFVTILVAVVSLAVAVIKLFPDL